MWKNPFVSLGSSCVEVVEWQKKNNHRGPKERSIEKRNIQYGYIIYAETSPLCVRICPCMDFKISKCIVTIVTPLSHLISLIHCSRIFDDTEKRHGGHRFTPLYHHSTMGQSQDPTYPLFPTFAFIAFVLSLLPLPWHIHAWNSGTCAFMTWTALSCFVGFVNSIVWHGSLDNPSPVWCDICK